MVNISGGSGSTLSQLKTYISMREFSIVEIISLRRRTVHMEKVLNDETEFQSKKKFIARFRNSDDAPQELEMHLNETSLYAGKFASKVGLRLCAELIGLLHDAGKASYEFDRYIRSATGQIDPENDEYVDAKGQKGKIDHSTAGAQIIHEHIRYKSSTSLILSEMLSVVIASHHSGLIDCLTPNGTDVYSRRVNKSDDYTRKTEAFGNLSIDIRKKIEDLIAEPRLISEFDEALALIKEKEDSSQTFLFKLGLLTRFLFSCLIDADRLSTADFENPERAILRNHGAYVQWDILRGRLEKYLGDLKSHVPIDHIRQKISDDCLRFSIKPKGLYQLTVPTGGGKTLSSLRFALSHAMSYDMDRVIYVIPYTSIIDQNAQKAREVLEKSDNGSTDLQEIVLEHHSNLTPEEENPKQKLLSENWDAPIVYTTMVQFLESLFGYGTRNARRFHQMANSVIIFDEIQTLPVKCVHLFNMAIRFLVKSCGSTVVLCTATQPLLDKVIPDSRALRILPEQQIIKNVEMLYKKLKRVEVQDVRKAGGWVNSEIADLVFRQLEDVKSVLIIVNTKKSAINLYTELKNRNHGEIFHLSTNMCPAHRNNVFAKVKKCLLEQRYVICVSTQLIEAGVDIDFGSVIRYMAGLDSIAQAAGRCNRNALQSGLGKVFVLNPQEEDLAKLIDIKQGKIIAERVFDEFRSDPARFHNDILSPDMMSIYYQYYFYNRKDEMSYKIGKNSSAGRSDNLFSLLSDNALSLNEYYRVNKSMPLKLCIRQSFMTSAKEFKAIDSIMLGIIVPYEIEGERLINDLCASEHIEKEYRLLKQAQRYSVNIFRYMADKMAKNGIIREIQTGTGILYLDKHYYNKEFGISESMTYEMETQII